MEYWIIIMFNITIVIAVFGTWFMYLRHKYSVAAKGKIVADLWLATGYNERKLVPVDPGEKSVTIEDFIYFLNPDRRRTTRYPENPILNLKWLQVECRTESWQKDNPEPIQPYYEKPVVTAAEVKALTREIQATTVAMQIQEVEARQRELTRALENQPNKWLVYIGIAVAAGLGVLANINIYQMGSIIMQ